jgi:hypothetical protein
MQKACMNVARVGRSNYEMVSPHVMCLHVVKNIARGWCCAEERCKKQGALHEGRVEGW